MNDHDASHHNRFVRPGRDPDLILVGRYVSSVALLTSVSDTFIMFGLVHLPIVSNCCTFTISAKLYQGRNNSLSKFEKRVLISA